jgi:oligosaccharide 4-alpha-D-glucosyltransferase
MYTSPRYLRGTLLMWLAASFPFLLTAQVVTVTPAQPTADDTVEIIFHADRGNQVLKDHPGPVYAHTGVIIGTADEPSGWRYVQGNWGSDEARMRLQKIAPNTYRWRIHIRSFYGIPKNEPFLQLAFVFRSQNGALVAKDEGDADIFYPKIPKYKHGPIERADGSNGRFAGDLRSITHRADGALVLETEQGAIAIQSYGPGAIRFDYLPYSDHKPAPSEAVVVAPQPWADLPPAGASRDFDLNLAGGYVLSVTARPLQVSLTQNGETRWKSGPFFTDTDLAAVGNISGLRAPLQNRERIYGFGSRAIDMNRVGTRLYGYNTASYGYTWGETALNISIPYLISDKGYGLFFDAYRRSYADIGQSQPGVLEFGTQDSTLSLYLLYGDQPEQLTETYTRLTGRQPMPPRWAMGYIQSRYGYRSQQELETVVQKTLDAGIPLDAVLFDLQWFGDKGRMGDLDWDKAQFPQPEKMMKGLKARGIQPLLITETYFVRDTRYFSELAKKGWFAKDANGDPFVIPDFWAGAAGLLDVFKPDAMDWFWNQYRRLSAYDVAGWWCDSGEPENHPKGMIHARGTAEQVHNIYAHYWNKGLSDRFAADHPNQRFFQLNRSGYAGMQRFSVFPWSGDVTRNWDAFRAQTPIMLSNGLCGIGYMHSDLGGFTGGEKNGELFLRWLQFGAFAPIMRVHGDATAFDPEPVFYDEDTRTIAREVIRQRYDFLPYNLQLARENTFKGAPLARPLFFHFPNETGAWDEKTAYMWGKNLLVCPVTEAGATSRTFYLPGGKWYEWYTGETASGGKNRTQTLTRERLPVWVRAGAWVANAPGLANTQGLDTVQLRLHFFPQNGLSADTLYFDDGQSLDYRKADGSDSLCVAGEVKGSKMTLTARLSDDRFIQGDRVAFVVNGLSAAPKKVIRVKGKEKSSIPPSQMRFEPATGRLYVEIDRWDGHVLLGLSGCKWKE